MVRRHSGRFPFVWVARKRAARAHPDRILLQVKPEIVSVQLFARGRGQHAHPVLFLYDDVFRDAVALQHG